MFSAIRVVIKETARAKIIVNWRGMVAIIAIQHIASNSNYPQSMAEIVNHALLHPTTGTVHADDPPYAILKGPAALNRVGIYIQLGNPA